MKNKTLKFGILCLLIGCCLTIYAGANAKININSMTSSDWQECSIKGIGERTESKLLAVEPISNIESVATISGIGTEKAAIIEKHFTTRDTCRYEIFMAALIIGINLIVIGALMIIFILVRQVLAAREFKRSIKNLSEK
jgi:hypothetical protein